MPLNIRKNSQSTNTLKQAEKNRREQLQQNQPSQIRALYSPFDEEYLNTKYRQTAEKYRDAGSADALQEAYDTVSQYRDTAFASYNAGGAKALTRFANGSALDDMVNEKVWGMKYSGKDYTTLKNALSRTGYKSKQQFLQERYGNLAAQRTGNEKRQLMLNAGMDADAVTAEDLYKEYGERNKAYTDAAERMPNIYAKVLENQQKYGRWINSDMTEDEQQEWLAFTQEEENAGILRGLNKMNPAQGAAALRAYELKKLGADAQDEYVTGYVPYESTVTKEQEYIKEQMKNTLEGAQEWLDSVRDTGSDEEQLARDNLWRVQREDKFKKTVPDPGAFDQDYMSDMEYLKVNDPMKWAKTNKGRGALSGNAAAAVESTRESLKYSLMTDDERNRYNTLYRQDKAAGTDDASAYLEYLNYALNERATTAAAQNAYRQASGSTWGKIKGSAESILNNAVSGVGAIDAMAQIGRNKLAAALTRGTGTDAGETNLYRPVDMNTLGNLYGTLSDSARQGVQDSTDWMLGNLDVFDKMYSLVMSSADSVAGSALLPSWLNTLRYTSAAAQDAMQEAYSRGASENQLAVTGIAAAAAEYLGEHTALEHFVGTSKSTVAKTVGEAIRSVLKQSSLEGYGEGVTELANILTDALIMQDKSDFAQKVAQYEKLGLTAGEAKSKAIMDAVGQVGEAYAGGMAQGVLMGGIAEGRRMTNRARTRTQTGRAANEANLQNSMKAIGQTFDERTEARKLADAYDAEKATPKESGRLFMAIAEEMHGAKNGNGMKPLIEAATVELENRLLEEGETKTDAETVAGGIVKMMMGAELTRDEMRAVAGNEAGMNYVREVLGANTQEQTTAETQTATQNEAQEATQENTGENTSATENRQEGEKEGEKQRVARPGVIEIDDELKTYTTDKEGNRTEIGTEDTPEEERRMLMNAEGMTQEAAQRMLADRQEAQDAQTYSRGFAEAYRQAQEGKTLEQISSLYAETLTDEQRRAAWEQGQKAAAAERENAMEETRQNAAKLGLKTLEKDEDVTPGLYYVTVRRGVDETMAAQLRLLDAYAKERGVQVRVQDMIGDGRKNGYYKKGTNIVYVSLSTDEGALTKTVSHELYHYLRSTNAEEAEQISAYVLDRLAKKEGYDLDSRIHDLMARYAKQGVNITQAEATEEIVADGVLDYIGTEENFKRLMKDDRTTAEKLADWARGVVEALKNALRKLSGRSPETRALMDDAEYVETVSAMMNAALKGTKESADTARRGAYESAMESAAVQRYREAMAEATGTGDREAALNVLMTTLWMQTQRERLQEAMQAGKTFDLSGEDADYKAFVGALKRYGSGEAAVNTALHDAGMTAIKAEDMPAVAYAGKQAYYQEQAKGEAIQYSLKAEDAEYYDYSRSFAQQVDDYLAGKIPERDTLVLGETPELYQQIGLSALPMVIDQTHVDYALNGKRDLKTGETDLDHKLGAELLKKLPELLRDPVMIIRSKTREDNSVVAVIKAIVNGHQQIAAVEVSGEGMLNGEPVDANRVTSTYGKEKFAGLLEDAVEKENEGIPSIYYIKNKVEARSLFVTSGVQFPGLAKEVGLIHSIFDAGAKVNRKFLQQTETQQFKRWFGKSKVVDADGNPMVMYHGTRAENGNFTVFDYSKAVKKGGLGLKALGKGNYFTSKPLDGSERFGSRVIKAYLSIQNPFIYDGAEGDTISLAEQVAKKTGAETKGMNYDALQDKMRELGYDGVIEYRRDGSLGIAVTFDSAQIKSATDNIGTFDRENPDIRYSLSDDETKTSSRVYDAYQHDMEFYGELLANQNLQEAASIAQKMHDMMVRGDSYLTKETREKGLVPEAAWKESAHRAVEKVKSETGSQMSDRTLTAEINRIYKYLNRPDASVSEAVMYARDLSKRVLDKVPGTNVEEDGGVTEIKRTLRESRFYLTEDQKDAIREEYGSVKAYTQKNFGKMAIRAKAKDGKRGANQTLAEVWVNELNPIMPGTFKEDAIEGDMPGVIDAFLQKYSGARTFEVYGRDAESMATEMALGIVNDFYGSQQIRNDKAAAMSAYRSRLETEMEEQKARLEEKMQKVRDNYSRMMEEKLNRIQEREDEKEAREKKRKNIESIRRNVKWLDGAATKPSASRHLPNGFEGAVYDLVRQLAGETKQFSRYDLDRIARRYEAMAPENVEESVRFISGYDEETAENLRTMSQTLAGKRLNDLSLEESQMVSDAIANIRHIIENENKAFIAGQKRNFAQYGDETFERLSEMSDRKDDTKLAQAKNRMEDMLSKNVTPIYFFKNLGGAFKTMFDDIMYTGQEGYAFDLVKYKQEMSDIMNKYHVNNWYNDGERLTFRAEKTGELIELDRGHALSLYATWQRETRNTAQNANHLALGGFIYAKDADVKNEEVSKRRAHPITVGDMQQVTNWLTQEQMDFANEMATGYMSGTLAERGNETTRELYGYDKFKEEYYFPYRSSRDYLSTDPTSKRQTDTQRTLRGWGSAKETKFRANNPIILDDFMQVVARHTNEMLTFSNFTIPADNMTRLLNYRVDADEDGEWERAAAMGSVRNELARVYGDATVNYINEFLYDLGGGAINDDRTRTGKMLSLFKKNAVMASASVAIQQPSAIMRAMALVSPRYFVGKPINPMKSWNEMVKYSGVGVIKEIGRADMNTGLTAVEWLKDTLEPANAWEKTKNTFENLTGWAPEKMDQLTWGVMWEAIKRETEANGSDMSTEEGMKAAGRRFSEVMNYTQVYDSTLSRSAAMRSNSGLDKMLTAFMAEPTVSYNLLQDAILHKGDTTYEGRVTVRRALAAYTANVLLNAMLKSIVTAARKDDDKRTYLEKYIGDVAGNFTGDMNPLTLVPVARDVVSIFDGYDVERSDMSLISDLKYGLDVLRNDDKSVADKIQYFGGSIAALFGVPLKNVMRDFQSVLRVIGSAPLRETSGRDIKYTVLEELPGIMGFEVWDDTSSAYYQRIVDAMAAGNSAKEAELRGYVEETLGRKSTAIKSGVTAKIKEMYEAGRLTKEKARSMLEKNGVNADDAYWKVEEWASGSENYNKYDAWMEAVETGKDLTARTQELLKNGAKEESLAALLTKTYKEQYVSLYRQNKTKAANLKARLLTAYEKLGYDREKKNRDIDAWLKDK